jgi:predicted nucleotide-binding protein (sugar kinase/HSP70/actin superfamily)
MLTVRHSHVKQSISSDNPLAGKTLYIPAMAQGSVEAIAAVFRALGIDARPTFASNARTLELGGRFTSGDECYPAKVTMGDFLRIIEQPGFDATKTAFFMATADGPCRFGQYAQFLKKTLSAAGHGEIEIFSPSSKNGYLALGNVSAPFMRSSWRALVCADTLRKLLLKTRPHESASGAADKAFDECLTDLCQVLEAACFDPDCQMKSLVACMMRCRSRFRAVPAHYDRQVPLIGVVGEIFCRLNNFSNEDLVRKLEGYNAECWISDIAEWIGYTNQEQFRILTLEGRKYSLAMLGSKVRNHVQHSDEHKLRAPFEEDFVGYEEPPVTEILKLAQPYLPSAGSLGEMVLSVGKAAYLAQHGADGIVDISPFTCMNGIVTESIYPRLSKDFGGIPIRSFYFDGTQSSLDRDLGIYMELVRSYSDTKNYPREYPACFGVALA